MFLTELTNLKNFFLGPDTTSWIMRATKNVDLDLIIYNILFQLLKINQKLTIFFHQRIANQLTFVEADGSGKRWVDWSTTADTANNRNEGSFTRYKACAKKETFC